MKVQATKKPGNPSRVARRARHLHAGGVADEAAHGLGREGVPQKYVAVESAADNELVVGAPVERVHALGVSLQLAHGAAALDVREGERAVQRARAQAVQVRHVPHLGHPAREGRPTPRGEGAALAFTCACIDIAQY